MTDTAEKGRSAQRLFPHSADIGVEGWGPTLEVAFEQAAFALTTAVTSERIDSQLVVEVSCEAPDQELEP